MFTRLSPILLAAFSGVLYALSFPDYDLGWLSFVSVAPLLIAVVRARRTRVAFLLGWLSGFVAWLLMVPWVIRVMSHYGGLPLVVGILLFVAMSAYLGIYTAFFAAIVHRLRLDVRFARWFLVPLAWAAMELVRTHLFTGFPWSLIAAAIVDYTPLIQLSRFAGPYFVGAMIVMPSVIVAWWFTQRPAAAARGFATAGLAIIGVVWWFTGYVATRLIARSVTVPVKAAMLQPNISQEMRWSESRVVEIYERMMAMTGEAIRNGAQVVIWPESTVPLSFSATPFYRESIEQISRQSGVDILLGSVAEDANRPGKLWNAAFLVSNGTTVGHYDKIRLVPFGEYVPMRKVLFFAEKLVRAVGEFEFGSNDRPLRGRLLYGPAICYEVVFPQVTRTQIVNGANVLVTITNDAWYDGTSAPRQHLNQARLRAVEGERYLLRAGTTGISAFIDPAGRIVSELPMGRQGIVYAIFEARQTMTPYVRFGDWFAWLACALVTLAIVAIRGRREIPQQD